jgi:ribose 1,5-bisphosphokinase
MTRLIAIVGPSGAGKDTLIAGAIAARPEIRLVRRVISRPEAAGGEDYEGVSEVEFTRRRTAGEFALDWQAHGLHYGIPKAALARGGDIVFNGSRAALPMALQRFPDLKVILITAPDAILAQRLAQRGREAASEVQQRLARAAFTLPEGISAQVVVNDTMPEVGIARLLAALQPERAVR